MGVLGWIVGAGVVGGIIKKAKEAAEEEQRRKNTPCNFNDGISEEEFKEIVRRAGKNIKRLTNLTTEGPVVYGTVRSQSGISEWYFKVDFNDYGHLSGRYWLSTDNDDSNIPSHVAQNISSEIANYSPQSNTFKNDSARRTMFCPYCGEKITAVNVKYCSYCGKKL